MGTRDNTRHLLPAAVVGGLVGLVAQGYYAGHRTLPSFTNLDPTGSFGSATGPVIRVAALGDSTLTGPGLLDPDDIWIRQLLRRLHLDVRVELHSLAVGGSKATDVRRGQLPTALQIRPDIAVVSIGANDAIRGMPIRLFRSEMRVITDALVGSGALVALLGVGDLGTIPRLPRPLSNLLQHRSQIFERVQRDIADGSERIVKVPMREIATEPFRTRPGMFSPDLFHPSRDGHGVWAEAALPTIRRLVRHIGEEHTPCAG